MKYMRSSEERIEHDKQHMLHIFPQEIWLLLFDKISEPNDKENFTNSSLFFREMVLPQRTQFLFKNVLRVLGRKYEENITNPGSAYVDNKAPTLQPGEHDLDEDEVEWFDTQIRIQYVVRKLCTVCKSWYKAVTDYCGNHYLHFKLPYYKPSTLVERALCLFIVYKLDERNPDQVDKILRNFNLADESSNINPFFGKNIFINFETSGESGDGLEFVNKLFSILTKFGHHIWHCTISHSIAQTCPNGVSAYYSRVRALLELMPNLRALYLYHPFGVRLPHRETEPSTFEHLATEMGARPLPTLNDLQVLRTCCVFPPIFQELIRSNSQISTLDISQQSNQDGFDIYSVALPKLKTFSTSFNTEADFEKLSNPLVRWSLQKLSLNFCTTEFMGWQRIFSVLQGKWAHSLTELTIELPHAKMLEEKRRLHQECKALKLNFPNLKVLTLTIQNLCCLDFLLSIKNSLLHLHVISNVYGNIIEEFADAETLEETSSIKLLSCVKRPLESNIWSLFPKLKRVRVEQFVLEKFQMEPWGEWCQGREEWKREMKLVQNMV